MRMRIAAPLACMILALGCDPDKPFFFEQKNLGVRATFPGEPRQAIYPEDTPFGQIQWYDFTFTPAGRMDANFHLDVGNLPPGNKGGATVPAALATFQAFLGLRLGGPIQRVDLPPGRGEGFQYAATGLRNARVEGVVILKRGRLHHAQATVDKADDPRVKTFLDSFVVN